jgi:hypothetical protein
MFEGRGVDCQRCECTASLAFVVSRVRSARSIRVQGRETSMQRLGFLCAALFGTVLISGNQGHAQSRQYMQVEQSCDGNSAFCDKIWTIFAPATGRLNIEFTVSNGHVCPVRLHYLVNGREIAERQFGYSATHNGQMAQGGPLTNQVDLGPVKNDDTIGLHAQVLAGPGSCGTKLSSWGGDMWLTIAP